MRAQERRARLNALDLPPAAPPAPVVRSAPASRRNSSSDDSWDAQELEDALVASVASATRAAGAEEAGGAGSPIDDAMREALAASLGEAAAAASSSRTNRGAARGASNNRNAARGDAPTDPFLDALRTLVVGDDDVRDDNDDDMHGAPAYQARRRARANPVSDTLRSLVIGDDVNGAHGGIVDVRLRAMDQAMTAMGVGEGVRRFVDRLLTRETRMTGEAAENAIPVEDEEDAFVSIADLKTRMRGEGISQAKVNGVVRSLRRDAVTLPSADG